ncbi:unnamed protein product [Pleuronectes platessa]|uniref:Uncharacterized protein n=1 Tax=Pleuronectes platessa TaxID=8262 RepID=A0A9N7Z9T6_PLEPL|nr:unnamed protein product [Pleuronectes platessa]
MRVNIPKDKPNMTCQAVPLQSQSMVSNHPDHDPPSRPERHSSPQSPSTATHHEPPPRSWSNARTRCQCDTGSHHHPRSSHTTQNPPHWIHHRDPGCAIHNAIHGAATEALDLRVIKQRDSGKGDRDGEEGESWTEKLRVSCVIK